MNAESVVPIETVVCGRCETVCDSDDNFCRHCGLGLHEQRLPSLRRPHLPVVWQSRVPPVVVRGAVFIAAGTLTEILARRLVRRTIGRVLARGGAPSTKSAHNQAEHPNGSTANNTQLVTDTLLMRHIRIRR